MMNGQPRKTVWLVAFLAVVSAAYYYWTSGSDSPGVSADRIQTATIERGDIERTVATSGPVRPLITVEVGSQLSGQVSELYADFNSRVEKGQVIAQIDPQTFASRVLQNQAELEVAKANVSIAKASIVRSEANLLKARLEFERAEPLVRKGTLSVSEFDTATASFDGARADLTMANAQLDNALATLQQRRASLESAEIDLGRTKIRSPIDGVVIERAIDQGQTVAASLSSPILFSIAQDLSQVQIEANVDEADIGNIKKGNQATFTVDAYPDAEFSGEVAQVRLAPNEENNVVTYTVIVTAGNPDLKLLPGMTAIVAIVTGKSEDVLRVANEAIRFKPPAGSDLAALEPGTQNTSGHNGGPPGGGGLRNLAEITSQLDLSAQQVELIEREVKAVFAQMMQSFRGGGPGNDAEPPSDQQRRQMRRQVRQSISDIFRKNLTGEQFERYEVIQREAEETRKGLLWVQSADGEIKPVQVRFGIADDTHTQVLGQGINEGDLAVSRIRAAKR